MEMEKNQHERFVTTLGVNQSRFELGARIDNVIYSIVSHKRTWIFVLSQTVS